MHLRLYNKAIDQAKRAEARRAMQGAEEVASMAAAKSSMSWISAEMMRERTNGPFENYGEMLYAEGLEATAIRKSKVGRRLAGPVTVQGRTVRFRAGRDCSGSCPPLSFLILPVPPGRCGACGAQVPGAAGRHLPPRDHGSGPRPVRRG